MAKSESVLQTIRPIEIGGFSLGAHGAEPISKKVRPTKQGWLAAASFAKAAEVAAPYWVGDLCNWLEDSSGWDEHAIEQLMSETGLARQTIYNAKSIAGKVGKATREAAPSFSHARAVAPLEPKEQLKVLEQVNERELTASQTAKLVKRITRPRVVEGQAELKGKYRVILVDCPWEYENDQAMPDGSQTPADSSYGSMTMQELMALPIAAHAMKDAVMFFWSTNAHLLANPGPRDILEAWGFTYKTNFVWNKVIGRPGPYGYMHHELLCVATRGACTPDVPILQHDHASIFTEKRHGQHSQKPETARKLITSLYPDGPYLELFGRKKVKGWTVFGNDARIWSATA